MTNYQHANTLTLDVPAGSPLADAIIDEHNATGEVRVDVRTHDDYVMGEALVTGVDHA
jgi:hypothetical protein